MTDVSSVYEEKFLNSSDLDGREHVVTIAAESVGPVTSQEGTDDRVILRFHEFERSLILTPENAQQIASVLNEGETSLWIGRKIMIGTEMGEHWPEIRVRPSAPPSSSPPPSSRAQPARVLGQEGAICLQDSLVELGWNDADLVAAVATRDPAAADRISGVEFELIPEDVIPAVAAALERCSDPAPTLEEDRP